jgi:choline-sulfatase
MRRATPLLLLALLGCHRTRPDSGERSGSNLLMISVDTFRPDQMARHGGEDGITPFLDDLASRSLVLDAHGSCSNWTLEAVLCATNGRYSADFDYVARIDGDYRQVVPERPSLASWLHDEGYFTVLLTANGWLENEWHHDAGYDVASHAGNTHALQLWDQGRTRIEAAVNEQGADRWFLHLHLNEPHAAYDPPQEYLAGLEDLEPIDYDLTDYNTHQDVRARLASMPAAERELVLQHLWVRYQAELRYFDDVLAELFQSVQDSDLLEGTTVVLWTDHGEQAYERGAWGHALQLYKEENSALALVWRPDIEPAAWTEPTSHIDIVPTALRQLGLEIPAEVTGSPVGDADPDRVLYSVSSGNAGLRLLATWRSLRMHYDWSGGGLQVFDLAGDPMEQVDVYDPFDPDQTALWEALDAYADELEPLVPEHTRVEPAR